MRYYEIFENKNELDLPSIEVGDEVMVGKFKNRKATVKGFTKDEHNQPVLKTDKGNQKLFKPRISKLEIDENELFEDYNNFPLKSFKKLFHVGSLNVKHKGNDSMEGAGLSVSTQPHAWMQISSRVTGSIWKADKLDNKFLNYYSLSKANKTEIIAWGEENGYIETKELYRNSWYDDDLGRTVYQDFDNKQEAEEEAGEGVIPKLIKKGGMIATDKLRKRVLNQAPPVLVFGLLTTVFAEDVLKIDGVWWQDYLDVHDLSAPRGVIAQSKVSTWKFTEIK